MGYISLVLRLRLPPKHWSVPQISRFTQDALSWGLATSCAFLLRFELAIDFSISSVLYASVVLFAIFFVTAAPAGLYSRRYISGSIDELMALTVASAATGVTGTLVFVLFGTVTEIPRSIALISSPVALLLATFFRIVPRLGSIVRSRTSGGIPALIYGAGASAQSVIDQIAKIEPPKYRVVGFVDDNTDLAKRSIRGYRVLGQWSDVSWLVDNNKVEVIFVAIPSASPDLISKVFDSAISLGVTVMVLPGLEDYLKGDKTPRNLKIDDILGRRPVELDTSGIHRMLARRNILITGAGGSIGSELARQVCKFDPSKIILLDHDESNLLDTLMSLGEDSPNTESEMVIADIRDSVAIRRVFAALQPEVVFHAAALKHVNLLEKYPLEAWKTNVLGTKNVLQAAGRSKVGVFVNISTDKAANPVNVLGKSKKIAEELTAWFAEEFDARYMSVRFGNVLGSRGSLVPIIERQIDAGGPVTVTHEQATRYFMSVSEACQLVLDAAARGEPKDVMILDMGEPINIKETVEKIIRLSGKQVSIKIVGLRPGEKLHEDLVGAGERLMPSGNPKILRFQSQVIDPLMVSSRKQL